MSNNGWIGVDLDGTLAHYESWSGDPLAIGEPVPKMVKRVREWLKAEKPVRIFTARVSPEAVRLNAVSKETIELSIVSWCVKHIGQAMPITCKKDPFMIELWDDRVVQVVPNTGERVDGKL